MTKLKPMNETPNDEPILALLSFISLDKKLVKHWVIVYYDKENNLYGEGSFNWNAEDFLGWIDLPPFPDN